MWQQFGAAILVVMLGLAWARPVWADPTDSGSINVYASVPPTGSSMSTAISATSENDPLHQEEIIDVTITYSSANVGIVPLTFQAQWEKGTVEGATEANVDVVTYVAGSATNAYGSTVPVIDTFNQTITWEIVGLAPGLPAQTVSFKLKTTANYTGSLKVSFPISVVVLSPVGSPDHLLTKEYQYVAPPVVATPSPSLITPTPTSNASTSSPSSTPSPTATPAPGSGLVAPLITEIQQKSVGAISARIEIGTSVPSGLVVEYGTEYRNFSHSKTLPLQTRTNRYEVVLTDLLPSSRYYYRVRSLNYPSEVSDIYTFETASRLPDPGTTDPLSISLSHQRTVLFSGPIRALSEQAEKPLVVAKNLVLDLNIEMPNAQSIQQVEAYIRSIGVLGMSTDYDQNDELQSQSTTLTKIGESLYVGKLRAPVVGGQYEVISRVEDRYGNIEERVISRLSVVSPLTVFDAKSHFPLEHVRVEFLIYNETSKLYEVISNVTTSIANPAFTGPDGIVYENFFPGKYKINVSMPGFESQSAEFQVGQDFRIGMPQIYLVPKPGFWSGRVLYFFGLLDHVFQTQVQLIQDLIMSRQVYILFIIISSFLAVVSCGLAILVPFSPRLQASNWLFSAQSNTRAWIVKWLIFSLIQVGRFFFEAALTVFLLIGGSFVWANGLAQGGVVLLMTLIATSGWICYQYRLMCADQANYQLKQLKK